MTVSSRSVLIVEDDAALRRQMCWALDRYAALAAFDYESAIALVSRQVPPVVLMDLGLPPKVNSVSEGFRLLEAILTLAPDTKVIVLTGQSDHGHALRAVGRGAFEFFEKPFEADALRLTVERAFKLHDLQQESYRINSMQLPEAFSGIVTRDPEMLRVCRTIEKVAKTGSTVVLLGESGTGKELLARGLHNSSPRRADRFVAINCAAIPENLLESELFGHEKGAFTGAVKTTPGKVEMAHRGTLLFDEIGDLPLGLQAKLLRFLQERVIERVGGRKEIPVDVRIVCATHQDLKELIRQGRFREDLYYRLAEIVVDIPPLRARPGDAAMLAHVLTRRFAAEQGRRSIVLRDDALTAIALHSWKGNVRELENTLKRAVIMAEGNQVTAADLRLDIKVADRGQVFNLRQVRDQAERSAVLSVLARSNGNVAKAAELLGVSRPTLYDHMHRFGLR